MKYKVLCLIIAAMVTLTACGADSFAQGSVSIEPEQSSQLVSSSEKSQKENSSENSSSSEKSEKNQSSSQKEESSQSQETSSKSSDKVEIAVLEKKDLLTLQSQYDFYEKNDSHIYFTILNNSDKNVRISKTFKLQKYNEERKQWEYLKTEEGETELMLDDTVYKDAAYPHKIYYGGANAREFIRPLSPNKREGRYRIEVFADKESYFCEFVIGEDNTPWEQEEVTGTSRYPVYAPDTEIIEYTISNNTEGEVIFGMEYDLQKLDETSHEWQEYKDYLSEGPVFQAIAQVLKPGESTLNLLRLSSDYKLPLPKGSYRIHKVIQNKDFYVNFEIDDKMTAFDKNMAERLYSVDEIHYVNFRKHNFTNPLNFEGIISDSEKSGVYISVFYMDEEKQLDEQLRRISDNGYVFEDIFRVGDMEYTLNAGNPITVSWHGEPHFFRTGTELILYNGNDAAIIKGLTEEFGNELNLK